MKARFWLLGLGLGLSLGAGAAVAKPSGSQPMTTVCVDVTGKTVPADCHNQVASRLQPSDDICLCGDAERAAIPVCAPGVSPPPESAEVDRLRREFLRDHHDLVGATWQGQQICVPPRTVTRP